jgi:hypothetical protein
MSRLRHVWILRLLPLLAAVSRCECYTVAYKIRGQLVEAKAAGTASARLIGLSGVVVTTYSYRTLDDIFGQAR